jgi:DnaJ-class molecular chaperone
VTTVEFTDYYAVLGVPRDADAAAIRAAYRKKARTLHPDVNKDPSAEAKFKQLNEANEVLKDPEKRAKYDRLGANWEELSRQEDLFHTRSGASAGNDSGFSDFFETFFGSSRDPFSDFEEVVRTNRGGQARTTFRFRRDTADIPRPPRRGVDVEEDVDISLEEAARGGVRMLSVNGRQVEVRIPAGVTQGSRVRVGGEGGDGTGGGSRGDVYLRVRLRPHPRFTVRQRDLVADLPVRDDQAVLGDVVKVDALTGPVQVRVPAGSQSGRVLRLRGKGLPGLKTTPAGDLLLTLRITVPVEPTEQERALYEELRTLRVPANDS